MSVRTASRRTALAAVLCTVAASCRDTSGPSSAGPAASTTLASTATTTTQAPTSVAPATTTTTVATSPATTTTTTTVSTGPARVVSRGDPARRTVALTFDAGSDTGFTAQILDILAAEGVPATFGLTGRWAEANRALVVRIGADGHQIVNHTYDHHSFTGVSATPAVTTAAARRDQLDRTDAVVVELTGKSTRPWFRPPYGDYDASVNADVGADGYAVNVLWTVDSLGWQGLSPNAITARCLRGASPGAIYLFHVGAASQDANALRGVIAGLRAEGYGFATVADLLAA